MSARPLDAFRGDAELQPYGEGEVVCTYGRLPFEYAAIYRSAGIMDMSHRDVVRVSGPDHLAFLNSILTAEFIRKSDGQRLQPGEGRFAFLLDRAGKIRAEMNVLIVSDGALLEMDARLIGTVVEELERYRFREKVTIAREPLIEMGVFGPLGERINRALSLPLLADAGVLACAQEAGTIVWRERMGEVTAHYILAPSSEAARIWTTIAQRFGEGAAVGEEHACPIGWAALNAARIEAGRPLFGIDYDGAFHPAETGQLARAVSFTKGCYPGQEIVARMQSRGQCARQVVRLELEDQALPMAGQKVHDDTGAEVGIITSSTISPRASNQALCLAVVRKPLYESGSAVTVPAEGAMHRAEVTAIESGGLP